MGSANALGCHHRSRVDDGDQGDSDKDGVQIEEEVVISDDDDKSQVIVIFY